MAETDVPEGLLDERTETTTDAAAEDLPEGITRDPATGDLLDSAGTVVVLCGECGGVLTPDALPFHVVQAHVQLGQPDA